MGFFVRTLVLTLGACLGFLFRTFGKPILLAGYRWSLPVRIALGKILRPAKQRLLYPLTTRTVTHLVIALITIVVSTNSLTATEVQTTGNGTETLLAQLVQIEGEDELTTVVVPNDRVPIDETSGLLAKDDGAEGLPSDEIEEIDALEKPLLSETTAAGQPRSEIIGYTVQGGDTVSTIAERFGISTRSLLWANTLDESDFIKPGQLLTVPPVSGVVHRVKSGETLQGVANKYKANLETILEFNQLASAEAIEADQVLVVPGGEIEAPRPTYVPRRYADAGPALPPPSVSAPQGSGLLWPTSSRRVNRGYFGYHRAIDIEGNVGSPIYSSADGRVESVSYIRYGYGYHVVVNHGGGRKTLYAHASRLYVKPGQAVSKGQTIAAVGLTGRTSGAHVHFELFVNGVKVNPWGYLR